MKNALAFLSAMQQISPREWSGPCPFCGDGGKPHTGAGRSDRFHVWPEKEGYQGGKFWCRKCGKSGDAIQLVSDMHGVDYRGAIEMLGGELDRLPSSAMRTPHGGQPVLRAGQVRTDNKVSESVRDRTDVCLWTDKAEEFLSECQRGLDMAGGVAPSKATITRLLCGRFISPTTALAFGIGYNGEDRYTLGRAWGLPEDGKAGRKIRLPRGIVIASKRGGRVVSLNVRLDTPEEGGKYRLVRGSADAPFIAGERGLPCFLFESALDAALAVQETRGKVCAVGMNGCRKLPDTYCMEFIASAPCVVVCLDNDEDKAGADGGSKWLELFPSAMPAYPIGAKDLGDMHKKRMQGVRLPNGKIVPDVGGYLAMVLQVMAETRNRIFDNEKGSRPRGEVQEFSE